MNEWRNVKDKIPNNWQEVLIKTDCDDCPILKSLFSEGKFNIPVLIQCDKHYETDEKFHFIASICQDSVDLYCHRITHWMPLPQMPKE